MHMYVWTFLEYVYTFWVAQTVQMEAVYFAETLLHTSVWYNSDHNMDSKIINNK